MSKYILLLNWTEQGVKAVKESAGRYDAAIVREAAHRPLAPARRKAELLHFARMAARRLAAQIDPTLGEGR